MYNIAISLYAFVVRLIAPFHRKAKLMTEGHKQTFRILEENIDPDSEYIWIHAASLGEFEQGRPLIEKIRKVRPQYKILLTFFSPSGYEVRKDYAGADVVCYLPFDLPGNVKRFLGLTNPKIAIFIKYEFWMNYLSELNRRVVPTYIVSAIFRLDQIFFRWYGRPYRKILKYYDWLFVQDRSSLQILKVNGINNTSISGDTRFDRVFEIYNNRKELPLIGQFTLKKNGQFTLVAGSTWSKDEEIILPYFNDHPEMKLIIAPHEIHASHLQEIQSRLTRPYVLYTQATEADIAKADCVIIDCFGLLSSIYRYGDAAYVGGGFGAGIHNVLEAAVYGMPVAFGPNYQKFKEARDLIQCKGAVSISDAGSFAETVDGWKEKPDTLMRSGKYAGEYVKENTGATDIILNHFYTTLSTLGSF